ncbi:casB, partial [Symbiodinium microadriaticum]
MWFCESRHRHPRSSSVPPQAATPGGYFIQNPDGTTSGPFYGTPPAGMLPTGQMQSLGAPVAKAGSVAAAAPGGSVAGSAPVAAPYYFARSVQAAWDNHFEAFGKQDLDKIMLDYDDTSIAKVYNNKDGSKSEFVGKVQIRNMFTDLFADLSNLDTLKAPVVDVDEAGKTVFLVWECPGCGYHTATDTFVFGPDNKIKRQNIVVTKDGIWKLDVANAICIELSEEREKRQAAEQKLLQFEVAGFSDATVATAAVQAKTAELEKVMQQLAEVRSELGSVRLAAEVPSEACRPSWSSAVTVPVQSFPTATMFGTEYPMASGVTNGFPSTIVEGPSAADIFDPWQFPGGPQRAVIVGCDYAGKPGALRAAIADSVYWLRLFQKRCCMEKPDLRYLCDAPEGRPPADLPGGPDPIFAPATGDNIRRGL